MFLQCLSSLFVPGSVLKKNKNPMFFLAENVSGISNANSGSAFTKILEELASAGKKGYDITVHKYKFEEYSIPQARHRFRVIGFTKDLGLTFNVPAPINADKPKRNFKGLVRGCKSKS